MAYRRYRRYTNPKHYGLPKGSYRSLLRKLTELLNERDAMEAEPSEAQSELARLTAQLQKVIAPAAIFLPAIRPDNGYEKTLQSLNDALTTRARDKRGMAVSVSRLLRWPRFLVNKKVMAYYAASDRLGEEEDDLRSVLARVFSAKSNFERLDYLNGVADRRKSLQSDIDRYSRAVEIKSKSMQAKMDDLRARAADSEQEVRDLASRLRDTIPKSLRCPYCEVQLGSDTHVDHIYPVSRGGKSHRTNLVHICVRCNLKKSDQTLLEFADQLGYNYMAIIGRLRSMGKRPA